MTALADSSVTAKALSMFTLYLLFFLFFLLLLIIAISEFTKKVSKNEDFLLFTIVYSKINTSIVKTISPQQYLPTHIRENTDFLRQKPRRLPSA